MKNIGTLSGEFYRNLFFHFKGEAIDRFSPAEAYAFTQYKPKDNKQGYDYTPPKSQPPSPPPPPPGKYFSCFLITIVMKH